MRRVILVASVIFATAVLASSCSAISGDGNADEGTGDGNGSGANGSGANGNLNDGMDDIIPPMDDDLMDDPDEPPVVPVLDGTISSSSGDTITVTGQPATVQFALTLSSGSTPDASDITWSVDSPRIGTVDANGGLSLSGNVGGPIVITATLGGRNATTTLTVNVDIVDTGNVTEGNRGLLEAGGSADAAFRWLYPYDRTVFPQGLAAPLLQFAGAGATAMYIKITTPHFSYRGFSGASSPLRLSIPQSIWDGMTYTARATGPVQVEVTKLSGSVVTGPITEDWYIAQASLRGIIYYSTYKSPLTGTIGENTGGLLRIRPGQNAEVVQPLPQCPACHSVSAQGDVLALSYGGASDPDQGNTWNPIDSSTYNLAANGAVASRTTSNSGQIYSMIALTPDGSLGLTSGVPPAAQEPFLYHGVISPGGIQSRLVNTQNSQVIATNLNNHVQYAIAPMFSPDGTRVAFVNGDLRTAAGCNTRDHLNPVFNPPYNGSTTSPQNHTMQCRKVLSMLNVDLGATPPVFSNPVNLIDRTSIGEVIAWPTFLPDSQGIIYHEGDSFDTHGAYHANATAQSIARYAELRLVETATGTVKTLRSLNGRDPEGNIYLPYGSAEERMNYEPNVLPVAIGGYYWVLFASRRVYGNRIGPDGDLRTVRDGIQPGAHDPWGDGSAPSWRKKIWIAAININYSELDDPSYPAFLLPGQELESANMRAFAALPPCRQNGQGCDSGSDCCEGFCRQSADASSGSGGPICIPPPENTCSLTDEPCDPAVCCNPTDICINNRCTAPPPPPPPPPNVVR